MAPDPWARRSRTRRNACVRAMARGKKRGRIGSGSRIGGSGTGPSGFSDSTSADRFRRQRCGRDAYDRADRETRAAVRRGNPLRRQDRSGLLRRRGSRRHERARHLRGQEHGERPVERRSRGSRPRQIAGSVDRRRYHRGSHEQRPGAADRRSPRPRRRRARRRRGEPEGARFLRLRWHGELRRTKPLRCRVPAVQRSDQSGKQRRTSRPAIRGRRSGARGR